MTAPFFAHMDPLHPLTAGELEAHIQTCDELWQAAYAKFQAHGLPHDREEALQHLHRRDAAILARSPAVQAARHAAFEERLSAGLDYFNSHHAQELGKQVGRCAR